MPENLLVNGRGRFSKDEFDTNQKYTTFRKHNNIFEDKHYDKLPLSTFFVTKGKKYRFRIIYYGFSFCPVLVSIQEHDITIISSDSSPVKPKKLKSFVIHSGER